MVLMVQPEDNIRSILCNYPHYPPTKYYISSILLDVPSFPNSPTPGDLFTSIKQYIPTVDIGFAKYKFIFLDKVTLNNDDCVGLLDTVEHTITFDRTTPAHAQVEYMLHELNHLVNVAVGLTEISKQFEEETLTAGQSRAWLTLIKLNPLLFELILKYSK